MQTAAARTLVERTPPKAEDARSKSLVTTTDYHRHLRFVWLMVPVFLAFRLWYASAHQLMPDEAVYWSWSRHPSGGYLDHPPMIAQMIRLSTHWLGSTELGVRYFPALLATGCLILMLWLAKLLFHQQRAVVWMGILWLTSPLLAGLGALATPDTPADFFCLCALACAILACRRDRASERPLAQAGWWLGFGVFCGFGLLSKYPAVLLPASVGLALLTSREGRGHLRRPWPYLAGIVALTLFTPVVLWNHAHDWASFRFQLHHGLAETKPSILLGLAKFIGGQVLIWTPVLFVAAIIVLARFWRRFAGLSLTDRILLLSATVPLIFFGYAATRAKTQLNWPAFAYFPLSLLIVAWISESWDPRRLGLVRNGCIVALVALVVIQFPDVLGRALPARYRSLFMAKLDQGEGWRELGEKINQLSDGRPIVCNRPQMTAELSFYVPGQPEVWPVNDGSRPSAFDYFDYQPDFARTPRVLYVGFHSRLFEDRTGYVTREKTHLKMPLSNGGVRDAMLVFMDRLPNGMPRVAGPDADEPPDETGD